MAFFRWPPAGRTMQNRTCIVRLSAAPLKLRSAMLHEFRLFSAAIARHWVWLMSGIVSICVWGLSLFKEDASTSVWIFGSFAVIALFVACFQAWRDEHRRASVNL